MILIILFWCLLGLYGSAGDPTIGLLAFVAGAIMIGDGLIGVARSGWWLFVTASPKRKRRRARATAARALQ